MAKPPKSKKSQNELVIWTLVLGGLLLVAGIMFWKVRATPEKEVHIPETAFEKTPQRSRVLDEKWMPDAANNARLAESGGTRDSKPISTELQRAMELVDQGHWEQAEPLLLAELARNPQDEAVLLELAMIQILDKHELQSAKPYLESALRVNPSNDSAMEELLGVYEEGQGWADALRFMESIPESEESRATLNYGKGNALMALGRNAEASELLRKVVYEDDNKSFKARESLATSYESTGRFDEASREYEQVIAGAYKPEQQRIAKIRLANTYAAQKNFGQARALLEPIVAANPQDKWAARVLDQIEKRENKQ